jgi:hypothetical protein
VSVFRRRKDGGPDQEPEDAVALDDEAEVDEQSDQPEQPGATQGPWDAEDAPEDGLDRLDLGGMRVPVHAEMELRVDVSQEGQVVAATVVVGESAMQVNAFAAPRTAGIWAEVADEIRESLEAGGGTAERVEGPFGLELRANIPADVPGQGRVLQPARFLGADGPRWFLRGLLSGPAATDPAAAALFEQAFREVVVVRGKDAMAPRDALPLRLPGDVVIPGLPGEPAEGGANLDPFERGPEITEIH